MAMGKAYRMTGPESNPRSPADLSQALEIDHALAEMEREIDLLLNLTPTNAAEAWADFERGGFASVPALQSRPLGFDPDLVKRRLYDLEIERVEDPALENIFLAKREITTRVVR